MIITMSPAKVQDFTSPVTTKLSSQAIYDKEANELYTSLKGLSVDELSQLMKINPQLARSAHEYINKFDIQHIERQAIFAYNGIAYQGLDVSTMTDKDLVYAQDHLLLVSGLYGLLRPLDIIKPYRLELQTPLKNSKGKDLYAFWKTKLSKDMAKRMQVDDNIWVNLSSKEYTKVIDRKLLPKGHQIITPIFKEQKGDTYKQIVVYAKKARGMMTRFIIQNQIDKTEYLKAFDTEGYCFSEQLSCGEEWVFIR